MCSNKHRASSGLRPSTSRRWIVAAGSQRASSAATASPNWVVTSSAICWPRPPAMRRQQRGVYHVVQDHQRPPRRLARPPSPADRPRFVFPADQPGLPAELLQYVALICGRPQDAVGEGRGDSRLMGQAGGQSGLAGAGDAGQHDGAARCLRRCRGELADELRKLGACDVIERQERGSQRPWSGARRQSHRAPSVQAGCVRRWLHPRQELRDAARRKRPLAQHDLHAGEQMLDAAAAPILKPWRPVSLPSLAAYVAMLLRQRGIAHPPLDPFDVLQAVDRLGPSFVALRHTAPVPDSG